MAYPITGPYQTVIDGQVVKVAPGVEHRVSSRIMTSYRQSRPYNEPLSFSYVNRRTQQVGALVHLQAENTVGGISEWQAFDFRASRFSDGGGDFINSRIEEAVDRCRGKLSKLLEDSASTLTSLVEAQSTITMIEKRLMSFVRFSNAVRRGSAKAAIREILQAQKFKSIRKEKTRVRRLKNLEADWTRNKIPRNLGSAWLEAWFGWLPTIGDVQKAVGVLEREFPPDYVRVSARSPYKVTAGRGSHVGYAFASAGLNVQVVNSNLYLASQLGLTNPLLTAVEVIPYSWLLGWFVNLDQYFKQFSTFQGIQVERPWHLEGISDSVFTDMSNSVNFPGEHGRQSCFSFSRSRGTLPEVTLRWKGLNRLSATRGATLASLLVGYLPSNKEWTSRYGR